MGIVARRAARPKSPMIRIGRLRSRSTQTPAGRVNRMNGRKLSVPTTASSNALASRTTIATKPMARSSTCDPNWLIVSADQSLRKSWWRQSPPRGHTRMSGARLVDRGPDVLVPRIDDAGHGGSGLGLQRLLLLGDRLRHVAEVTLRREEDPQERQPASDPPGDDRLAESDPGPEDAACEGSDRDRPPDDEAHHGVHPPLQARRADR